MVATLFPQTPNWGKNGKSYNTFHLLTAALKMLLTMREKKIITSYNDSDNNKINKNWCS